MNAEQIFAKPMVEFGVLMVSLSTSAEAPEALLAKLETLA